jgi:hypothetical protein
MVGLESVDVNDSVVGGYVAFRFSRLMPGVRLVAPLSVGAGIKSVSMRIAGFKAGATATDLGFLISLDTFRFALGLQNLGGGYKFPGTIEAEADALPSTLRAAASFVPVEDASGSLTLAIENASYVGVSSSQKFGDVTRTAHESLNVLGLGAEYWRLKKMGVRLGYMAPWGSGSDSYSGSRGLAVGISFRIYAELLAYQVDVAYHPLSLGSDRQDVATVSLSLRF